MKEETSNMSTGRTNDPFGIKQFWIELASILGVLMISGFWLLLARCYDPPVSCPPLVEARAALIESRIGRRG